MKNLILISTLLFAGTLAANATAPTGTYTDEGGKSQNFKFNEVHYEGRYSYTLDLSSGTYKNVTINSNDTISLIRVKIGSGVTFDGFTFNGVRNGIFLDDVDSVLGGKIEFSNVIDSHIKGKLSSGTHFLIDSNSQVYFYSNVWNIKNTTDLSQSLIDGTGTVAMNSSDTFTLNFLSAELLKEQTISLVSADAKIYSSERYSRFKNIAITVAGQTVEDWFATQSTDGKTILISRAVPEPSMFGLLAGTLALALAGTRRRRRK